MSKARRVSFYNSEGYPDPTTHDALNNIQQEDGNPKNRADALIGALKYIIKVSGFELLARIEFKDTKTGREYR